MRTTSRLIAGTGPIALAAGMLLAASAAQAQDAGASQSGDQLQTVQTTDASGDKVIVVTARNYVPEGSATATKSDIPLIETPQSVTVITRDQIDLLNFIDAQQAVRYVAGVTGENYGPDLRFDFIQVRGFTPKQFIDGLATPVTTTIFSNGVDLYNFESFDILKGPASVLYGNSPPGGIYNQTSRRASDVAGGEISAKYGEDDYKQIAGTITGPLGDNFEARLTGLYRDRDAERDFVHAKRALIAPTATAHLGSSTSITGLGYYQHDRVEGDTNGFLPAKGTLLPNPVGKVDRSTNLGEPDYNYYRRNQWGAGFEAVHDFSRTAGVTLNTKWSDYNEYQQIIYGSFFANGDNRTVGRSSFPYREEVKSFAADGRFHAEVATGAIVHKLLVGIDYRNVRNDAAYGFGGASNIDLFDPVYGVGAPFVTPPINTRYNEQRLRQTGIYAQDQIGIGNLFILLSGRQDWTKSDYIAPFTPLTTTGPVLRQDESKFTYRVGANYVTPSGFAPYISYATSFEPVLGGDTAGNPFKPTTGRQIEGGVKFDGRNMGEAVKLFGTAALYQIDQRNVVSTLSGPQLPVFGTQTGKVEVWGAELELVARIREQLSINGSYSYTHSEVKESNNAAEIGQPLPVTPKHKASLFVDYTLQKGALGGLGFGAGVRYVSESAGALPSLFEPVVFDSDSSTLFDAIVHYDTPKWRFAVNASNLFDKTYVARCAASFNCTYGAGRQVIGTATYKF
jgi:iron complex outermembrane receptor protein